MLKQCINGEIQKYEEQGNNKKGDCMQREVLHFYESREIECINEWSGTNCGWSTWQARDAVNKFKFPLLDSNVNFVMEDMGGEYYGKRQGMVSTMTDLSGMLRTKQTPFTQILCEILQKKITLERKRKG